MKIAVFGSAFNPPTNSHLKIIEHLVENFDKVLVVPCFSHNFGKKMINFKDRLNMAKLLVSHLDKNIEVSDIEQEIFKNEVSRTYLLLKTLKENNPNHDYVFVCGEDNASIENWKRFYNYKLIDEEFGKYIIPDLGTVRSTFIRQQLKIGETIDGLTRPEVIDYIRDNHLVF